MKMPHTPGPWEVAPHPDDAEMVEVVRDYVEIAGGRKQAQWIAECDSGVDSDMSEDEWQQTVERNQANARLIAAAPDLLAACERSVRLLGQREGTDAVVDSALVQIRAAIAKAEG